MDAILSNVTQAKVNGMSRRAAVGVTLAGATGFTSWSGTAWAGPGPTPWQVGQRVALPALPLIGGGQFGEREAAGRVVVLYWWASWCPFCSVQSPHMQALWAAQRNRGLTVLGVSIDKERSKAEQYLKSKAYTWPSVWIGSGKTANEAAHKALPRGKGLPVVVVRGRDGLVKFVEAGEMFPEDVEGLKKFV